MSTWLKEWNSEDSFFWESKGKNRAWKTLWITTIALTFSFATWFIMSALVVKLNGIGFNFTQDELFWLAAIPGLAGGIFRIIHTFLLPIYGTRHVITFSTFIKIIPCIGIGFAVMDTSTPFWVFITLAFLTGFGGGDFSSYMPSTNLFFPSKLKGTALGVQAGIGNFGVSLVQFLTPIMIGVGVFGSASYFTKIDPNSAQKVFEEFDNKESSLIFNSLSAEMKTNFINKVDKQTLSEINESETTLIFEKLSPKTKAKTLTNIHPKIAANFLKEFKAEKAITEQKVYLQTSVLWFIPFLLITGFISWYYLRSVPMKASFKEQLDIFGDKHTWYCTVVYLMTFGGFAGLSASFPILIKSLYGNFPNSPDPLTYAFYGPLIGSSSRVMFGFLADKVGGAILTTISGIGLFIGTILLLVLGLLTPTSLDQFPLFVGVMLLLFFFTGIGNASTFRQFPIIFSHNPRQASGVIGWTAAVAAFGPFIFSMLILMSINATGKPNAFFIGLAIFAIIATCINWFFYQKKGCERPS